MPDMLAPIAVLSGFMIAGAVLLGYLANRLAGAAYLGALALGAAIITLTGAWVPTLLSEDSIWSWIGLVGGILIVAGLAALWGSIRGGSKKGKRRGALFIPALWLGFCFVCGIGYGAGGWLGLLTISLLAVILFWGTLYLLARFVLPMDTGDPIWRPLRCLLTFAAGTNYPYYVMQGRRKVERVAGDQGKIVLAGPGLFLTGPDHVVAVSSGLQFSGVRGPGVIYTTLFESIQVPMDLRPQQREFSVEATTKDGIRVRFKAFGPFQLDTGEEEPRIGGPFPYRKKPVFDAFHAQPLDIKRQAFEGDVFEERKQRRWDELYEMIGSYVLQDIISTYEFDDLLYEPEKGTDDPREEIAHEYHRRMKEALASAGIRIPGGRVSNLMPADSDMVFKHRLAEWQADKQRQMVIELGEAEAEAERILGKARATVQREMIKDIGKVIAELDTGDPDLIIHTVALNFVESLNHLAERPEVKDHVPHSVARIIGGLPRVVAEE